MSYCIWIVLAPTGEGTNQSSVLTFMDILEKDFTDLKDFMRKAGEVTYVDAHRSNRNEGVVEFASYNDMKSALDKLDGTELSGRKIKLIEDRKKHRSRSRSRSYSRSRSKSKSRGSSRSASRSRSPSRTPEKKYTQKSTSGEPSQSSPKRQSRSSSAESRG